MIRSIERSAVLALTAVALSACGGSQPPVEEPVTPVVEAPASPDSPAAPAGTDATAPGNAETTRPAMTAEECAKAGGMVVGDIGDGAIHRPDYRCSNGSPPLGSIRPPEGGPIAIEGSVCCPK